ncbi:VOC family protein [Kibdelosporangium lantanae]|uniref:VOC family protein n=1 Tax=Kibdelosporangium lantanae TaxID=1497396 RepID=A0ABW3M7Q8_9PSEU
MATEGIEGVYVTTHNWGKTAGFFQELGYALDFRTEDGSGMLRNGDSPYVVLVEVPDGTELGIQLVLKAPKEVEPDVEVVTPFEDTHYGTREMIVRDPDGRTWNLQAPRA